MNYLLISNVGVAPVEGYTLLGMSTTRDSGVAGAIGMFGSGTKHAINLLLRRGVKVWIYCGLTRLEFFTADEEVNDGLGIKIVKRVMCKLGGTSSRQIDCGWCLDFGAQDWTEVGMGIREFVSNAIDRTIRQTGGFKSSIRDGSLKVTTVEESARRAKDGHTQIFIELTDEVQAYFGELPKRFLHFSRDPDQVYQRVLPKADRNLTERKTPMIYRHGVLVREFRESDQRSLFDYNFGDEIKIDESRNSSEYTIRAECAKFMRKADKDTLVTIYKSLVACEDTFESHLDVRSYVCPWSTPEDEEKKVWTEAWEEANDGATVLCKEDSTQAAEFVQRKGYAVKKVRESGWVTTAGRFGVATASDILSENEQKGREMLPPTAAASHAVDTVWSWLEALGMTKGKDKPKVGGYRELMDGESDVLGFWEQGSDTVFLREDISSACNKMTLKVALEEVGHYVTGATDNSRDFQQFFIEGFVELAI
jgi:hypothetical protein